MITYADNFGDGLERSQPFRPRVAIAEPSAHATHLPPVDEGPTVQFSEDSMALQFVDMHHKAYRWTPGLDWMRNAGEVWKRDDELTRYSGAREICRANALEHRDGARLAKAAVVNGVLTLAKTDRRIVIPASAWDSQPMLLNTPQGVIDLQSGRIRQRMSDDYFTQVSTVSPAFGAGSPVFDRFMKDVFCNDVELIAFMYRLLGYCLTGDRREQVLFFWHGAGANGKSTLLDFVQKMVGSYCMNLPADELMTSRNEKHKTGVAGLRGKRLAVSSELEEGQFWNEPLVKSLTGDATMSARLMRQDFFSFDLTHKHLIVGNFRPRLRGGDPAMARRLVLVPFKATFDGAARDKAMPEKLWAEAPAVLAKIIQGAAEWHTLGLCIPDQVRAAGLEYMDEHDDLALWAAECCARDGEGKAGSLYASFSAWKQARGEHATSQTAWGARMALMPGVTRRRSTGGVWVYTGARLTSVELDRVNAAARA